MVRLRFIALAMLGGRHHQHVQAHAFLVGLGYQPGMRALWHPYAELAA